MITGKFGFDNKLRAKEYSHDMLTGKEHRNALREEYKRTFCRVKIKRQSRMKAKQ